MTETTLKSIENLQAYVDATGGLEFLTCDELAEKGYEICSAVTHEPIGDSRGVRVLKLVPKAHDLVTSVLLTDNEARVAKDELIAKLRKEGDETFVRYYHLRDSLQFHRDREARAQEREAAQAQAAREHFVSLELTNLDGDHYLGQDEIEIGAISELLKRAIRCEIPESVREGFARSMEAFAAEWEKRRKSLSLNPKGCYRALKEFADSYIDSGKHVPGLQRNMMAEVVMDGDRVLSIIQKSDFKAFESAVKDQAEGCCERVFVNAQNIALGMLNAIEQTRMRDDRAEAGKEEYEKYLQTQDAETVASSIGNLIATAQAEAAKPKKRKQKGNSGKQAKRERRQQHDSRYAPDGPLH